MAVQIKISLILLSLKHKGHLLKGLENQSRWRKI